MWGWCWFGGLAGVRICALGLLLVWVFLDVVLDGGVLVLVGCFGFTCDVWVGCSVYLGGLVGFDFVVYLILWVVMILFRF